MNQDLKTTNSRFCDEKLQEAIDAYWIPKKSFCDEMKYYCKYVQNFVSDEFCSSCEIRCEHAGGDIRNYRTNRKY